MLIISKSESAFCSVRRTYRKELVNFNLSLENQDFDFCRYLVILSKHDTIFPYNTRFELQCKFSFVRSLLLEMQLKCNFSYDFLKKQTWRHFAFFTFRRIEAKNFASSEIHCKKRWSHAVPLPSQAKNIHKRSNCDFCYKLLLSRKLKYFHIHPQFALVLIILRSSHE